ncbi:MAG: hypothetical protein WA324_20635 [Bryobacteraceae bacterium]
MSANCDAAADKPRDPLHVLEISMALRIPLQATACLIVCATGLLCAEAPSRPTPIAASTETGVIDGGLGTAPAIALPRVETSSNANAAAELSHPFTPTTTVHQPNHLASRLLKIGLGGTTMVSNNPNTSSANGKFGLKGLLLHKTTSEAVNSGQ